MKDLHEIVKAGEAQFDKAAVALIDEYVNEEVGTTPLLFNSLPVERLVKSHLRNLSLSIIEGMLAKTDTMWVHKIDLPTASAMAPDGLISKRDLIEYLSNQLQVIREQ